MKVQSLLLILLLPACMVAQSRLSQDAKGIVYDKENALDMRLHTHGWMVGVNIGKLKTYYKTTFYHFQVGELKNHKESRKSTDFSSSVSPSTGFRSYVFGKQNYALALRAGIGVKRYYSEKAAKNGVAVALTYSGGITAALMKPYYLEVGGTKDVTFGQSIKYTPENAKNFLDPYRIRGKAGLLKGIGESSIIPGAHAQVGVHLDWGAFDEFLRAMEVGVMLDVFPKKLPIMINEENRPFYLNLYVSLQLGKRN
jgi:hypothetical protein